jgi:predicted RNase H-like HicB family nuclease
MEEGGYYAECPIIQGCHVEGDTYAEAIENLQDAIQIIIAPYRELEKPFSEILLTSKNTTAKIS